MGQMTQPTVSKHWWKMCVCVCACAESVVGSTSGVVRVCWHGNSVAAHGSWLDDRGLFPWVNHAVRHGSQTVWYPPLWPSDGLERGHVQWHHQLVCRHCRHPGKLLRGRNLNNSSTVVNSRRMYFIVFFWQYFWRKLLFLESRRKFTLSFKVSILLPTYWTKCFRNPLDFSDNILMEASNKLIVSSVHISGMTLCQMTHALHTYASFVLKHYPFLMLTVHRHFNI